jgi:phage gp29-like protein
LGDVTDNVLKLLQKTLRINDEPTEENMALIDAYGKEIRGGRPVLKEIGVSTIRDMYSDYPSQGLTPERLAAIFREADTGDILRQAELFEEMEEKDAHLGSVLQTRKLAAAGLEWELVAASEGREDESIASFAREALGRIGNLDEALLDILDAIAKGFSVTEIMWEISCGRVWIKDLRWRHQKKFTFYARDRILDMPRLITENEPVYGEALLPNKFVVHRYRGRSGIAPRAGLLRPCAYMYLFKNYTLKDWVVFNERFAMPMRVGKFSPGTSEDELRVLRNAVFNLGTDAAAVISDSTVIELLESSTRTASSSAYEQLAEFCNRAMSKVVLGHTGSVDSTPGKLGNEDQAKEVRQDILESDAKALAKTVSTQIVRPLVEYNFGPDKMPPVVRFHYAREEDLKTLAETYATISGLGIELPPQFIRERFGVPAPGTGKGGNADA